MKINRSYTIDEELIEKIKKEAKLKKRSESFLVNEAIIQYLNKK